MSEKGQKFSNSKKLFGTKVTFFFLDVCIFSSGGFFTFLVTHAHSAPVQQNIPT